MWTDTLFVYLYGWADKINIFFRKRAVTLNLRWKLQNKQQHEKQNVRKNTIVFPVLRVSAQNWNKSIFLISNTERRSAVLTLNRISKNYKIYINICIKKKQIRIITIGSIDRFEAIKKKRHKMSKHNFTFQYRTLKNGIWKHFTDLKNANQKK